MFIIEIAKLKIKINNKYSYIKKLCEAYIAQGSDFDFEVEVTDSEIREEAKLNPPFFKEGQLESICIYRNICLVLPKYDAFLIHASSIAIDDMAYLFCAKSGTGKTTHTKLLKEYLGDRVHFINGDKPIIRIIDSKVLCFGSPWNGKEGYGENISKPVKAIIFLERSKTNEIIKINEKDILKHIMHQIIIPSDEQYADKTFELLNYTLTKTNKYLLKCNMEIDSAICSYTTITK